MEYPRGSLADIRDSNIDGKGLFANRDIPAGALIFDAGRTQLGILDNSRLEDTCWNCFRSNTESPLVGLPTVTELKTCSGCKRGRFCSQECQRESWKRLHKYECKKWIQDMIAFTKDQSSAVSILVRAVLELSARQMERSPGFESMRDIVDYRLPTGQELTLAIDRIGGPIAAKLLEFIEQKRITEVLSHVGGDRDNWNHVVMADVIIVQTNHLPLRNSAFESIGWFVNPWTARINHSCDPNAFVINNGANIEIRSLRPIKDNEEVFISYLDDATSDPMGIRQTRLLSEYYFECRCSKCERGPSSAPEEPPQSDDARHNELRTQTPEALAIYDRAAALLHPPGICFPKAQDLFGNHELFTLLNIRFRELLELDFSSGVAQAKKNKLREDCLKFFHKSGKWSVIDQPVPALQHVLFRQYIRQPGTIHSAFYHGLHMYYDINPVLYPVSHDPRRLMHTFALLKVCEKYMANAIEGGQGKEYLPAINGRDFKPLSTRLIKECAKYASMAFGEDHEFTKEVSKIYTARGFQDPTEEAKKELEDAEKAYESSKPFYQRVVREKVDFHG